MEISREKYVIDMLSTILKLQIDPYTQGMHVVGRVSMKHKATMMDQNDPKSIDQETV